MKEFYGDLLYVRDEESFRAELMGGNDRAAIITIASHAEAAVEVVVGRGLPRLREADKKDWQIAFRHDGPLGTFSACIDMAFNLGLIDERLRDQLDDLRHMRNAVAHTKRKVTFDDGPLQNVAKRLFAPRGMFKLLNETPDGIRRTFLAEGLLISSMLTWGRDEAIRRCRENFASKGRELPF